MNRKNVSVSPQVKDLEQSLQATEEQLSQSRDVVAAQEAQIQKLVSVHDVPGSSAFLQHLCRCPRCAPVPATVSVLEQSKGWESYSGGSVLPRTMD